MFGFDERFAMFDTTPVDNQFILDYMPGADGNYVKVYLYGLLRCYHPEKDLSTERMSRDLNLTEDEVTAAFRYWERRGFVRRVSDNPPRWQYVSIKQTELERGWNPPDPEYEEFSRAIYDIFDGKRRLHGSELNTCFEWQEKLKLPTEVIVMLLNHMMEVKGRNFRITDAEKVAARMADENVRTVDAAEEFFTRDGLAYDGVRNILKKMNKHYPPSEAQVNMYRKWVTEWHFTPAAVEEAVKLTAGGDPNLAYLDGILKGMRRDGDPTPVGPEQILLSSRRTENLRQVLKELGRGSVNPQNLALYDRMSALYGQDVILTAARECGHSGKAPEDVLRLLESWKEKGLDTESQVDEYIRSFHEQTALIREIRRICGTDENRIGKTDRSLVSAWQTELGFSRESILEAAGAAAEAGKPMTYLDRLLKIYREKGLMTPEEIRRERETRRDPGTSAPRASGSVSAQQYRQRNYGDDVQDQLIAQQDQEIEEYLRGGNGGKPDA